MLRKSPQSLVLALLLCACSTLATQSHPGAPDQDPDEQEYTASIESWRAERLANLTRDTGWLTLTGLYPLEPGSYLLGSTPEADIPLPASAPDRIGTLLVGERQISLDFGAGVDITADGEPLVSPAPAFDEDGGATVYEVGSVSFFVIQRGDVRLLRVRDRNHPDRASFAGIESFAIDPAFRFAARFEPYDPVKQIPIANIIGIVSDSPSWGAVVFEHGGETFRIDVIAEPGDEEMFLIFADATSGKETYGAGRYLYVKAPDADGMIELDFNKAYNPPCAFTPFATCPLPPRQNRLSLRVEAGEKNYAGDGH